MNHKSVWDKILGELKKNQPKHAYSTWFVPIKPIALNNNALLLELPNQFFYEWIQSHYKETIEKTMKGVTEGALDIKFTVSPEAFSLYHEDA